MNKITVFVEGIFSNIPMNEELENQKEIMISNMTDKYNKLINNGHSEDEVYNEMINNFKSTKESKVVIGIENKKVIKKSYVIKVLIGMLLIALITLSNSYLKHREFLHTDMQKMAQKINLVKLSYKSTSINDIQDNHYIIKRNLNYFEKEKLENTINDIYLSHHIFSFIEKINKREDTVYWNANDQIAKERFDELLEKALIIVENEGRKVAGYVINDHESNPNKIKAFFAQVDVESISDSYREINELALCYTRYGLLPEKVTLLTKEEVVEVLKAKLNRDDISVEFRDYTMVNRKAVDGMYERINVSFDQYTLEVSIDAYNGNIQEIRNSSHLRNKTDLDVVNEEDVENTIKTLIDQEANYSIEDVGINYKSGNSVNNLSSYKFTPNYYGYEMYHINQTMLPVVYFTMDTGVLVSYRYSGANGYSIEMIGEHEIIFDKEEALTASHENMNVYFGETVNLDEIEYESTQYVMSTITSKYDLMHIYNYYSKYYNRDRTIMIHSETGVLEN